MREKERVSGEEEGKTNLVGRESVKTYCKCKNSPNMSLLHQWSLFLLKDQWQRNGEGRKMIGDATLRKI